MAFSRSFLMLVFFAAALQAVVAAEGNPEMQCNPNGECSDPCVHFSDGTVFVLTEVGAKIKYRGQVYSLLEKNIKSSGRHQSFAEVPGDTERRIYVGKSIHVTMTKKVLDTSCYGKNEKGEWESFDKCCWTSFDMILNLKVGSSTKVLRTEWAEGC